MIILLLFLFLGLIIFCYFFVGSVKPQKEVIWGVNFSQKHAKNFGLDWKETYSALISDLGVKNLKVAAHWDILEPEKDSFYFEDLDWQVNEAEKARVNVLLAIGMKTPRWPECHIPDWAKPLSKEDQQKEILKMLEVVVLRYKDSKTITSWQVENEPFFPFGDCPWVDKDFLKVEIEKVRLADYQKRLIMISDSGEGSFWIQAAKMGDKVGTTMYRKVWFTMPNFLKKYLGNVNFPGFYLSYPFPPAFYGRKAEIIEKVFHKDVICVELQAEPWGQVLLYDLPVSEQEKTMNQDQFKKNIEFAKKSGLGGFYLWGAEWWYWLKEKQNSPIIWEEAKKIFNQ